MSSLPKTFYTAPLSEHKGAIPRIALWFEQEWRPWYGPNGPGNAVEDLALWSDETSLPFAYIAVTKTGKPIGIAALKTDGLGEEHGASPLLSALFVAPEHRRQGVALALIHAIETAARGHGIGTIFSATDEARKLLERAGWKNTGLTSQSLRGAISVYRRDLD